MADIEEIAISKFKATCLAVLERVRKTGQPIRITRFGEPVAEIVPPAARAASQRKLGSMAGEIELADDLASSVGALDATETLKEWDELNRHEAAARHAHLDLESEPAGEAAPSRRARHRKPEK